MKNPFNAIKEWWKLVKDNGYLYIIVPDEDLYEQKNFPSKYNDDHKWTFSIFKQKSSTVRTVNLLELINKLNNARLIKIEIQDSNYDYKLTNVDQTLKKATAQICFCVQKNKDYKNIDYIFNENKFFKNFMLLINCFFVNTLCLINIMTSKIKSLFK